jgi:HK97 family phage major capsid protein
MPTLTEAEKAITALTAEQRTADQAMIDAKKAFEESKADPTDVKSAEFQSFDAAGRKRDELLEKLANARTVYAALKGGQAAPAGDGGGSGEPSDLDKQLDHGLARFIEAQKSSSVGRRLVASDEFKSLLGVVHEEKFGSREIGVGWDRDTQKALIGTGATASGAANLVTPQRGPLVNLVPQRPLRIIDLVTKGTTDSKSIEYPVLVARGMAAGYVKDPTTAAGIGSGTPAVTPVQAGLKPETSLQFDMRTFAVKTIASWIPVHKNMIEDAAFIESLIDALLRDELDQRIETDIVASDGSNDTITGIYHTDGIGDVDIAADADGSVLDAAHMAMTQVRLGYEEPTAYGINPITWETIRLLRDASGAGPGTGSYLFGPPSQAGDATLWGKPVVVTTAIPEGSVLTGDFAKAIFWLRTGTSVKASDSHLDYFTRNLVAILAELRAAFGVVKPRAFAVAA